ncbi:Lsr2 family protein [Streptomyces sp. NPDC088775]|uniref:histone-like nucleoid-structuring protein Lsr2 n=1 Tax=Streptomyces sp. NPDC088775 TaxID=3365896 RepID=UPI003827FAD8
MAQRVRVQLIDDLDGEQLASETVSFSLDGQHREIDLSSGNAATFRKLLQPYMTASRPAAPTNLATKGILNPDQLATQEQVLPPDPNQEALFEPEPEREPEPEPQLTQAMQRQAGRDIRRWAKQFHLPVNALGRIPEKTRKAWLQHIQFKDRTLLDELLAEAGIDPATIPAEPASHNVVPITSGKSPVEDHLERRARTVGKLSDAQRDRLREACCGNGTAKATDPADRSSYQALVRRGCMNLTGEDTYAVTDVGRTWIRLNQRALTA